MSDHSTALPSPPGSTIGPGGEPIPEGPIQPGSGRGEPLWKRLAAPLIALGLLLSKLKAILLILLVLVGHGLVWDFMVRRPPGGTHARGSDG